MEVVVLIALSWPRRSWYHLLLKMAYACAQSAGDPKIMVDKHRHMCVGVMFTTCSIQMDGLIFVPYEYANISTYEYANICTI